MLLKVDVYGSIEAVQHLIEKVKNEQVQTKIILSGVGAINLSDVNLAITTNATILGLTTPLCRKVFCFPNFFLKEILPQIE